MRRDISSSEAKAVAKNKTFLLASFVNLIAYALFPLLAPPNIKVISPTSQLEHLRPLTVIVEYICCARLEFQFPEIFFRYAESDIHDNPHRPRMAHERYCCVSVIFHDTHK